MTRVDVCASDDFETRDRLLAVLSEIGGIADEGDDDSSLGVGLHRFRMPGGDVTVFVDAWQIDLAGPAELVQQIVAAMSQR